MENMRFLCLVIRNIVNIADKVTNVFKIVRCEFFLFY